MVRISIMLSSVCCTLSAIILNAQNLPKHPTGQQVISYRLQQEKAWQAQQLPKNSVLYKHGRQNTAGLSYTYSFKKQKERLATMPSPDISSAWRMKLPASKQPSLLRSQLSQQKGYYNLWKKQSWWRDPQQAQGSLWLRDFLINSKNKDAPRL